MAKRYRFRFKSLDVYQAAVQHFAWTVEVVRRLPRGPFIIPNQMVGASLSIMGNVAEANVREKEPGEVEEHYRYAQGSTFESAGYLDALSALEVIDHEEYNFQEEHLDRMATMLTRLMQTQRKRREFRQEAHEPQPRGPEARAHDRVANLNSRAAPSNSRAAAPNRRAAASNSERSEAPR